jgi:hypothetical protein
MQILNPVNTEIVPEARVIHPVGIEIIPNTPTQGMTIDFNLTLTPSLDFSCSNGAQGELPPHRMTFTLSGVHPSGAITRIIEHVHKIIQTEIPLRMQNRLAEELLSGHLGRHGK